METLDKINQWLDVMADDSLTKNEMDYPFVEAATFADDIKYHGGGW